MKHLIQMYRFKYKDDALRSKILEKVILDPAFANLTISLKSNRCTEEILFASEVLDNLIQKEVDNVNA